MKIAKYIILELLIIVLSLLWGTMMTNDHQSGEICITPAWGAQIQNYLEFGWNITSFMPTQSMKARRTIRI